MINTQEKIFHNALGQTLLSFGQEHNLGHRLVGTYSEETLQDAYNNICWLSRDLEIVHGDEESLPAPCTFEEFATRFNEIHSRELYTRFRKAAYPPIEEYIDGLVKGDQTQVDAYIAKCQEVKQTYPKDMTHPGGEPGVNNLG